MELALSLHGRPLGAQVLVAEAPAALSDIVPLARSLSTLIARTVLADALTAGQNVPCRKGCSHCCKHLVPLSVPEAFRLSADLEALPPNRRRAVTDRFISNAQQLILAGPPDVPAETIRSEDGTTVSPTGACGRWYAECALTCPLADGDLCGLYDQRPIACREHMVTSDPALCEGFQPGRGRLLPMPVSMLDALVDLTSQVEATQPEAIIMSLAPAWVQLNRPRQERTWPAMELVARLIDTIRSLARGATDQSAA